MPGFDILDPKLDLMQNYFLEASAGTGKTFTIENCVLRLIQQKIPIGEILVVTFTRAAVLELKNRIGRALEEYNIPLDESKIFTIHSFCFHTLKEHAMDSGFSLNQNQENTSPTILKNIFKDFLRTQLTPDEIHPLQLEKVIKKHQYDIENILKKLRSPISIKGRAYQEIVSDIEKEAKQFSFPTCSLVEQLRALAPRFGKMCDRQKRLKPAIEEGLLKFANLFNGDFNDLLDLPVLHMVPENLLKKQKDPYPELLERFRYRLFPLLAELSDTDKIMGRLASRAQSFFSHVCEEEDLYFYDDLLQHMQRCVHVDAFAKKVRENYKAVLIDEFQDTDPVQWDIFSTLFLGAVPLYLVGDPKQSIYRFRGADLHTYVQAKEAMGTEACRTLLRNFRSEPELVEALNILFQRTPNLIPLAQQGGHLTILPLEAALTKTKEGKVIFCRAEDEMAYFSYILQEIEQMHQRDQVPYRSFAVLVKDRYQAKRFCAYCSLPVVTKRSESLKESAAFPVLEDLLQAVYNPKSRPMLTKVLGGPLFGCALENLKESIEANSESFYQYHHLLKEEGILSFFQRFTATASFPSESFYLEMLQLVQLIAENTENFEDYLPFIQDLKREDSESESLKAWAKSEEDAIQVMTIHVSKGLEFPIVFPAGLMLAADMEDLEDYAEKMRGLYVAITRAKERVYLPIVEKETTPISAFMTQVLQGEALETFARKYSCFDVVDCEKKSPPHYLRKEKKQILFSPPSFDFEPISIYSYSSLAPHPEFSFQQAVPDNVLPAGAATGTLLHTIFERLDFKKREKDLSVFLTEQLKGTHLESWIAEVEKMVCNVLYFPLPAESGTFCLADVDPKKMKREMEFLYSADSPVGYVKGYIDLFFEHQGKFYIIDWKSNLLAEYTPAALEEAVHLCGYDLQAQFYRTAAQKFLNIFNKESAFDKIFFMFLRGLDIRSKSGCFSVDRGDARKCR